MYDENIKEEWIKNLKSAYEITDTLSKDIKTLVEIIIYTNFGEKVGRLYKITNDEMLFSKLIDEFGGNQIDFPSKEEFKESIMTAVVYYYKEVLGYDWKRIQKELNFERDMGLRYSRKINNLGSKIKKRLQEMDKHKIETENEESLFN